MSPAAPFALGTARTWLFCPGDRPERFAKAAAAGSDLVVLDLEDAVAADRKAQAREQVVAWLRAGGVAAVRINPPGSAEFTADLAAVGGLAVAVMLPKAEVAGLAQVADCDSPIVALIETARGVAEAGAIAADPAVARLALGSFDLAAELGVDPLCQAVIEPARVALVYAAAAAGLPGPIDGVTAAVTDPEPVRAETARARSLGMTGKLCIHPAQLATVHAAFAPGADEIAWAERVLAAVGPDGLAVVDGAMVDRPVVLRAERILSIASSKGTP